MRATQFWRQKGFDFNPSLLGKRFFSRARDVKDTTVANVVGNVARGRQDNSECCQLCFSVVW